MQRKERKDDYIPTYLQGLQMSLDERYRKSPVLIEIEKVEEKKETVAILVGESNMNSVNKISKNVEMICDSGAIDHIVAFLKKPLKSKKVNFSGETNNRFKNHNLISSSNGPQHFEE